MFELQKLGSISEDVYSLLSEKLIKIKDIAS